MADYLPPFKSPVLYTQELGEEEARFELAHRDRPLALSVHRHGLKLHTPHYIVLPYEFGTTFELLRSQVRFLPVPEGKQPDKVKQIGVPEGIAFEKDEERLELKGKAEDLNRLRDCLKYRLNQVGFHQLIKPIKKLGKGNFGTVYLVERYQDGKVFAAKSFLKYSIYSCENGKESLQNEILIMRQLDHPNLMRVYEIYETKNSIYVLIEQLRGGSLADHAKSKAFSLDEVKVLMKGLLEGLTYLHAKRIMHRDIKPDNIMFRTEDVTQVVLADFGLATSLDVEEYIFTRCGSPGYVAPEVINLVNLKNKYQASCDIYSLGCIFYQVLTGRKLFNATTHNDMLRLNKAAMVDFKMSDFLEMEPLALDLIKQLLEREPANRITAKDALRHKYFDKVQLIQIKKTLYDSDSSQASIEAIEVRKTEKKPTVAKKKVLFDVESKSSIAESKDESDRLKDSIGVIVVRTGTQKLSKNIKQGVPSFAERLIADQKERRNTTEVIDQIQQPEQSPTTVSRRRERRRGVKMASEEPTIKLEKVSQSVVVRTKEQAPKKAEQPPQPGQPEPEVHEVVIKLRSKRENIVVVSEKDEPYQIVIRSKRKVKAYAL